MSELKTLKDLIEPLQKAEKKFKKDFSEEGKTNWIQVFSSINSLIELKQEAIKWIKDKREKKKKTETHGAQMYANGYVDALIDFFNITEEDLK